MHRKTENISIIQIIYFSFVPWDEKKVGHSAGVVLKRFITLCQFYFASIAALKTFGYFSPLFFPPANAKSDLFFANMYVWKLKFIYLGHWSLDEWKKIITARSWRKHLDQPISWNLSVGLGLHYAISGKYNLNLTLKNICTV